MALLNIHVFVEDEVITADDLNSIGEAVSAAVGGAGSIAAINLTWPLVAQGDIDMNGYSITNADSFFNVYHVNDSLTLAAAVAAVNSDSGGTIVIDPSSAPTASDLIITASNVSILGTSGLSKITVSASAVSYGIRCTGNNLRINGCQFTGGATGIPAIQVHNATGTSIEDNTFSAHVGPCMEITGTGSSGESRIMQNSFNNCSEEGIVITNLDRSTVSNNVFTSVAGINIKLPGDGDDACNEVVVADNAISSAGDDAIYAGLTASSSSHTGLVLKGNVIDSTADDAINIGLYQNCAVIGNVCSDNVDLGMLRSTITGNTFNSTTDINTDICLWASNRFRGVAVEGGSVGANNAFNGNFFEAALEIDATWIDSFVGNILANGITITANDPDVVGLNWGY